IRPYAVVREAWRRLVSRTPNATFWRAATDGRRTQARARREGADRAAAHLQRRRRAVRSRRPGLARRAGAPRAHREERRPGLLQRQPAPEHDERLLCLLRVLLV